MDKYRKSDLRKLYLEMRRNLAPDAVETYNDALLKQAQTLDWSRFSIVHTFLPILSHREPDTIRITNWLKTQFPTLQIAAPRVASPDGELTHHILEDETELIPSKWGVPEPQSTPLVSPKEIDAVLVPLLVIDEIGQRVGYGRGFYDRFLAACRADVITIGLSFFEPIPHIEDVLNTDIPLTCCLTPEQVHWFRKY